MASVYRQSALFAGHSVLRLRPDGVVFGLLGSVAAAPAELVIPLGTALRAGEVGDVRDDDPGASGVAGGNGCAG